MSVTADCDKDRDTGETHSRNMSTVKAAAVVGFGVGAMLLLQARDPLDFVGNRYPIWRETGLLGDPARAVVCIIAGVSLLALERLYRLLFCPLELLRAPDDVGYIAEDGRSRAQAANEVRRRRKTGELPPVYPNGWYRVLDSRMLERGEVKNVSVLGMISSGCIKPCKLRPGEFRYLSRCYKSCQTNGSAQQWGRQ